MRGAGEACGLEAPPAGGEDAGGAEAEDEEEGGEKGEVEQAAELAAALLMEAVEGIWAGGGAWGHGPGRAGYWAEGSLLTR